MRHARMAALGVLGDGSAAWLAELKNTLSGVFGLAAVFVYLTSDESRRLRPCSFQAGIGADAGPRRGPDEPGGCDGGDPWQVVGRSRATAVE
jgi:hypothetical protein